MATKNRKEVPSATDAKVHWSMTGLDAARITVVGDTAWCPFPRAFPIAWGNGREGDCMVKTADIPAAQFRYASYYKFGGLSDAIGGKNLTAAKKVTKGDERYKALVDGSYEPNARKKPSVHVPALLRECVAVVARRTQKSDRWIDSTLLPFTSGAQPAEKVIAAAALAWAAYGRPKVPTAKQVTAAEAALRAEAQKVLDAQAAPIDLDAILAAAE